LGFIANKIRCTAGDGGDSVLGAGGAGGNVINNNTAPGVTATGFGGGGGGAAYCHNGTTAVNGSIGGSGCGGVIIVWEYS
jgi:hypothetical protein